MCECRLTSLIRKSKEDKAFQNDLNCIINKLNDLYNKQIKFADFSDGERFNLYLDYLKKIKTQRYNIYNIVLVVMPLSASILLGFASLLYTKFQKLLCQNHIEDSIIFVTTITGIVLTVFSFVLLLILNFDCHKYDDTDFIKEVINKYY